MAMAVAVGASGLVGEVRQNYGLRNPMVAVPRGLGPTKLHLRCSRRLTSLVRASQNGRPEFDDKNNKNEGEKGSVDWDKAWESFPKPKIQSKNPFKSLLSMFNINMEQYVNRRPTHSRFPLSEEVDPTRKTERRALDAWTDPKFTYAGVGVVVGLFVYMVVVVGPPPS